LDARHQTADELTPERVRSGVNDIMCDVVMPVNAFRDIEDSCIGWQRTYSLFEDAYLL